MRMLLFVILLLLILGGLPTWRYSHSWGYFPSSTLAVVLLVLIIVSLFKTA
jgi:Protein of unknown function (DUF3309)